MIICVFGASSDNIHPEYIALGEALGERLAQRGHTLLFGGGAHGLMGAVARGARRELGSVVGVAPDFFDRPGIFFPDCAMVMTDTMAERKTYMERESDAFIALPGGVGTMEELFEVITLHSLGRLPKPVAMLDARGYWTTACELLQKSVDGGFAKPTLESSYAYFTDIDKCLNYCEGRL